MKCCQECIYLVLGLAVIVPPLPAGAEQCWARVAHAGSFKGFMAQLIQPMRGVCLLPPLPCVATRDTMVPLLLNTCGSNIATKPATVILTHPRNFFVTFKPELEDKYDVCTTVELVMVSLRDLSTRGKLFNKFTLGFLALLLQGVCYGRIQKLLCSVVSVH